MGKKDLCYYFIEEEIELLREGDRVKGDEIIFRL